MLTKIPPTQNVSVASASLEFNVLFEKTNISTLLQKQVVAEFSSNHLQTLMSEIVPEVPISPSEPIQTSVKQQVELSPYPESDYQWLVEVLEALTSIVSRNASDNFTTLAEADYEHLDAVLKELIYVVGDDEKHPLALLMDFVGVLTTKYEDDHFPKLADLFPELVEGVNPNYAKDGTNRKHSPTKSARKTHKRACGGGVFFYW